MTLSPPREKRLGNRNAFTLAPLTLAAFAAAATPVWAQAWAPPAGLGSVRRFGLSAYTIVVDVPPGGTVTVALQLTGAIARSRDYQLTVVRQPTVNSDHIDLTLNGSQGWRVVAFPGFQLAGRAGKASIGTGRTEILTARLDTG